MAVSYQCGDECRLPVVAVNDIGPEIHPLQEVHHAMAEKAEPPGIVRIIALRGAVETGPVVEILVFQKVDRDITQRCLPQHALLD